jgi:nucleoside 2-deoxyribosyltransferase
MNIYFACSITGGRQDQAIYLKIVEAMLKDGHEVPTAMLAGPEVSRLEGSEHPADEVYARDVAWIEGADAMVAEVSTPSHGVGFEIGYALNLGKPVLALHHEDRVVSKMILGNKANELLIKKYLTDGEAIEKVRAFLKNTKDH